MNGNAAAFTVRLERRTMARVLTCAQYTVETQADGRKILSLYEASGPVEDQTPTATIALEDGVSAYVMNGDGNTVDALKARR